MKIRSGFVSNSSSSSFVINLDDLSANQFHKIENHHKEAKNDAWNIEVKDNQLKGSTIMNNFNICSFLEKIGVDMTKVRFEDYY